MYLPPQKLQCSIGMQEFLTNSQKYFCTFQLFFDAIKITNFWLQQHNFFLEWVMAAIFCKDSVVRGLHVYKAVCALFVGKVLDARRKDENSHDRHAAA